MNTAELTQVLRLINAVRRQCDLPALAEIPQGTSPDTADLSRMCPLAHALPQTVIGADFARTTDRKMAEAMSRAFARPLYGMIEFPGEFALDLPEALLAFLHQYDEGLLPQFIEANVHA